jgi:iron complex outermembrane receptor protein
MHMPMSRKAWMQVGSALGLVGVWLLPVPAHAQSRGAQDTSRGVENVVVTARRRAETLSKVPDAITAIGATQLKQRSITTEADLQRAVPGLTLRETFNANQISFAIRGQTIDAFSGSRPAVIAYFDDVQIPSGASSAFYDLESVQVLKGPQGTLFGRNATGGAVLYSTTKPHDQYGGYVTAGIGNYGEREFQGAVDLPIVPDKLLVRIAADNKVRDGYVHNIFSDSGLGAINRTSGRVTVVLKPIEGLDISTTAQMTNNHGTDAGGELYSAYGCGSKNGAIALNTTAACLYSPLLDSVIGDPGAWNLFLKAHPGVPAGGIPQALALQKAYGPWTTNLDEPEGYNVRGTMVSNVISYEITPDVSVKNILGYGLQNNHMYTDLDGSPFPIEHNYNANTGQSGIIFDTEQYSEEAQVLGHALDKKLTYIFGFYYGAETDRNHQNFEAGNVLPLFGPSNGSDVYVLHNRSVGVFAQGTYDLSALIDHLSITLGGRKTWDYNEIQQSIGGVIYQAFGVDTEKESNSKPSWQFGLEYQPSADWIVYFNQRGSWRAGGFNGAAPGVKALAAQGGNEFLPETDIDFELGAKYQGRLFDRPAHMNIALYDQQVTNAQRTAYTDLNGALIAITSSVPKADIKGIEIDGDFAPVEWLRIGGSLAYTDAQYTRNSVDLFGQIYTFNSYADTPRASGDAFAQIFLPLAPQWGTASLRSDIYAQTIQYFSNTNFTNTPGTVLPSYALINMHADWNNIYNTKFSLSAFVTNLADRRYYVGGFPSGTILGINTAVPGMPRMFGFEGTYKF